MWLYDVYIYIERETERERERAIYRLYRVREYCEKWSGKPGKVREFYYLKSLEFCAQTIVILSSEYHQMVT